MRINRTVAIYLALWAAATVAATLKRNAWLLLLPLAAFVANELVYQLTGESAVPSGDLTELFYDLSIIPTRYGHVDHNYSEGYYPDGDYAISASKAERNKFEKILEMLGAREGDIVLDMGCGTCSFGQFCAGRGVKVVGLTLSSEQVDLCESKGVRALRRDFTEFVPELEGTVDHVLMMGSTEHVHGGPHRRLASFVHKHDAMTKLVALSRRYIRPAAADVEKRSHRLFFSGLHLNLRFASTWESAVLQRAYGGTLMLDDPRLDFVSASSAAGLREVAVRDSTFEYYMATALNQHHFGNPSAVTSPNMLGLLALGALYHYAWFIYAYYINGLWMWMFDGKRHPHVDDEERRRGGAARHGFSFQADRKLRPATLVWCVAEY